MKHLATSEFWQHYHRLPPAVQELADRCFLVLKTAPNHPSLHLKKVGRYWSVRVGRKHRAVAVEAPQGLLWFWIGVHADYDGLLQF